MTLTPNAPSLAGRYHCVLAGVADVAVSVLRACRAHIETEIDADLLCDMIGTQNGCVLEVLVLFFVD